MKTKNKKLFGVSGVSANRVILQRVWLGRDLSKWPCVAGASPSQIKKRHIGLFSIRFLWQVCKYFDRCEEKSSEELVLVRMWTRYDQYLVYCLNVPFAGHLCPTCWVNSRSLTSPVDHERRTCIELRVSEREMFWLLVRCNTWLPTLTHDGCSHRRRHRPFYPLWNDI